MTPTQQAALEALVGRALTQGEVDQITPLVAAGSTQAIADILSVGRTKLVSGTITTRGAAAAYPALGGLPGALAFQLAHRKLVSFAATAKASQTLSTSLLGEAIELQITSFRDLGLDFSSPALRGMLDIIVQSGGITAEEAAGFKGLAVSQPDPITHTQVGAALAAGSV